MTRTQALKTIIDSILDHMPESSREELYNFQNSGFSDAQVSEMINMVRENDPDLDPDNEYRSVQAILVFEPSQERVRADALKYLADYSEDEFIEEFSSLEKINDIFEGANLGEDEIRAAFRKV